MSDVPTSVGVAIPVDVKLYRDEAQRDSLIDHALRDVARAQGVRIAGQPRLAFAFARLTHDHDEGEGCAGSCGPWPCSEADAQLVLAHAVVDVEPLTVDELADATVDVLRSIGQEGAQRA